VGTGGRVALSVGLTELLFSARSTSYFTHLRVGHNRQPPEGGRVSIATGWSGFVATGWRCCASYLAPAAP